MTEGVFLGIEQGDYAHWNMRVDGGGEVSFFILKPDDALEKVADSPDSHVGHRCARALEDKPRNSFPGRPENGDRPDHIGRMARLQHGGTRPQWRFATKRNDQDLPLTTVRLVVNGKAQKITAGRTGEFHTRSSLRTTHNTACPGMPYPPAAAGGPEPATITT